MDRRIRKTREAICSAYFRLLQMNKGSRITVAEITRQANIDRKTFYLHYNCVDDILDRFCDEKFEELLEALQKSGFLENPLRMNILFAEMNRILEENRETFKILANNSNYSFWDKIHPVLVQALLDVYADRLAIEREEMKVYCDFCVSGIMRLYQECIVKPTERTTEQIERVVMDIALNGITNLLKKE